MNRKQRQPGQVRAEIAATAARLLADGMVTDFQSARRKAARELGCEGLRDAPDNLEIHRALIEHLMLFDGERHRKRVARLREAALKAMTLFAEFSPRLTGAVLYGTACEHDDIDLQLFSDEVEAVTRFLLGRRIAYELTDALTRVSGASQPQRLPVFRLALHQEHFALLVLPAGGAGVPLSALDGRPAKRAAANAVLALLESGQTILSEPAFV